LKVKICRLVAEGAVSSNDEQTKNWPLVTAERYDFYPWSSPDQVLKRGTALIFSNAQHSELAEGFERALQHLEYSPDVFNLSETRTTLHNSNLYEPFLQFAVEST
jgi:hypothetical protein